MWCEVILIILSYYLYLKLSCGKTKSSMCLVGKTAVVTGGNSGIGYQTCLNLASRGCRVIIADKDDSELSRRRIIEQTSNSNVVSKKLDLTSFKSIRQFVADINSNETNLNILVNNAGVGASKNELTEDGLHLTMQVNYFGPFLLTHLLLDLLKKSAPSRIVFTSSSLAFLGSANVDKIQLPNNLYTDSPYDLIKIYSNSKLATVMASDIFAEKLEGTGVTSNSVHPGYVRSDIFNRCLSSHPSQGFVFGTLNILGYLIGKNIWEGAQTTTHVAISEELDKVTGEYFWDCRKFPKPLQARNGDAARKVWVMSEKCVNLALEEKIQI